MIRLVLVILMLTSQLYAECISGNCRNGRGTYIWTNGDRYIGWWVDNKPNGHGTFYGVNGNYYVGNFYNGLPHGLGLGRYNGKDVYGWWERGQFKGEQ